MTLKGRNNANRKKWRHGVNRSITVDPSKNKVVDQSFSGGEVDVIVDEIGNNVNQAKTVVADTWSSPTGLKVGDRITKEMAPYLPESVIGGNLTKQEIQFMEAKGYLKDNGIATGGVSVANEPDKIQLNAESFDLSTSQAAKDTSEASVSAEKTQTADATDSSNSANKTNIKDDKDETDTGNDANGKVKKKSSKPPRESSAEKLEASLDIFNDTNWDQNILHDYESVTYDATFFMANKEFTKKFFDRESALSYGYSTDDELYDKDDSYSSNDLLKDPVVNEDVVIIARTGETITTINSLEFENVLGLTRAERTNLGMKFRMSITQPQSTNLIKQIFLASQRLGIERYQTHPFFIQVFLKGRKKDGSLVGGYESTSASPTINAAKLSSAAVEIPGTRRLYSVMVKNMQYKVDVGGAIYDIEGTRYGDVARADDHVLVSDIRLPALKNFKDFTGRFTGEIMDAQRHELGVTKYLMDQYDIVVLGEDTDEIEKVMDSRIITDAEDQGLILNSDLDTNKVTTEIDYDASITEVIERHLTRTEYFVKNIKGIQQRLSEIDNLSDEDLEKWDDVAIGKKAFTITPVATPEKFDPLRNDYQRSFKYVIYISSWATLQAGILSEYNAPTQRHKQRVSYMMQNAQLSKKYSYHYTGQNLDVLDFDLTYNFQYVFPYDQLHGIFKDMPDALRDKIINRAKDLSKHKQAQNEMKVDFDKMAEDGVIDAAENRRILEARRRFLQEYTTVIEDGTVEPDSGTLVAYESLVQEYNKDIQDYNKTVAEAGGVQLKSIDAFAALNANNQSNRTLEENDRAPLNIEITAGWRLAETLNKLDEDSSDTMAQAISAQFYARTMDNAGGTTDVGNEDNAEAQRIIENAFAGGPTVDLMNVSMDIIGDPYWLPHPEIDPLDKTLQDIGVASDPKAENMVLFQTLYPKEANRRTGFIPPASERTDDILTCIYRIYRIEHRFDNGQFTQRLHMQRDALTDLSFISGQREKAQEDKSKGSVLNTGGGGGR